MNIRHRLLQIRKLSARNLPKVVARRLISSGRLARERLIYTPRGPRRAPPLRTLRPIGLLHSDVVSSSFSRNFTANFPDDVRRVIAAGNAARDLTLDFLGSGPVLLKAVRDRADLRAYPGDRPLGDAARSKIGLVPWHVDVKSGVAWPADSFYSEIKWGAPGVDVKLPWKLSHAEHFVSLGQAYALTRDESYTRAFCDQLEDWIRSNPPKFGVNWACAMDVSLRACNWLLAWEFFALSPEITPFVRENLAPSLWEHGRHIADHLEWGGELSTNHYLSDLLGLVYIGRALGERRWCTFGFRELSSEIENQTRTDGFHHESSTAYHRFVLEIFVYAGLAATAEPAGGTSRRAALERAEGTPFINRLRQMARAQAGILDNQGRMPLIGDNDSGHVHNLLKRDDNDAAYVADLCALLLAEDRFRRGDAPSSETAWFFGLEAARRLANGGVHAAPAAPGESGIAVLRGPTDVLIFAAQPNGTRGVGNHTHNDKLSFCLTVGRDAFLSDPGTLTYTAAPEDRNAFRRTAAHTTVQVDDLEQNRFISEQIFELSDDASSVILQFKEGTRVAGQHDGYSRLIDPVLHKRSIERIGAPLSWIIEDEFDGAADHALEWHFICGPGITAVLDAPGVARLIGKEGAIEINVHPTTLKFERSKSRFAPAYGVAIETDVLTTSWRGKLPFRATFTAVWRMKEDVK